MIKHVLKILLSLSAVMVLPVCAGTPLTMTVKLTGSAFDGSVKVWDFETNKGIKGYYELIQNNWTQTLGAADRINSVFISLAATDQDEVYCKIQDTTDYEIPLDRSGITLEAVDIVAVEKDGLVESCDIVFLGEEPPPVDPNEKILHIYVLDSDLASSFTLNALHYDVDHQKVGDPLNLSVPAGGDISFLGNVLPKATDYSTLSEGGRFCAFTEGPYPTRIYAPDEGASTSIYVDIQKSGCTLSWSLPGDDSIAISTCAELKAIAVDAYDPSLYDNYHLVHDLNGCTMEPIPGTFQGTFDGRGASLINLSVTGTGNIGLFEKVGTHSEIKNVTFINAKVGTKDIGNGVRGLIAGTAEGASISGITVEGLSIDGGNKHGNIDGNAAGGIVGIALNNAELSNIHLHDLYVVKNSYAGGLIGRVTGAATVKNASVREFTSGMGGKDCHHGAAGCAVGGVIGSIAAPSDELVSISSTSAKGVITTQRMAGGLIGQIELHANVSIDNSYADMNIREAGSHSGGLIGWADEQNTDNIKLNYVYAMGRVELGNNKGGKGIISKEDNKVSNRVHGSNSVFDMDTTGQDRSGDTISVGKTTKEMQALVWPFSHWKSGTGQHPNLLTDPENK